jgi:hypothetical protein
MGYLWDALSRAYDELGFDRAAGGDEVFAQLVLARIIEPASKRDSLRVLEEAGIKAPSYRTFHTMPSIGIGCAAPTSPDRSRIAAHSSMRPHQPTRTTRPPTLPRWAE